LGKGEVKGLKARNGFEVSIQWEKVSLKQAIIKSLVGEKCVIRTQSPIAIKGLGVKSVKILSAIPPLSIPPKGVFIL
jgi:alpha-L-fucosidase 2